PGRRGFLALVRGGEVADVVDRVVVADVLERVGDRLDQVVLLDDGHGWLAAGGGNAHFRRAARPDPAPAGPRADRSVPRAGWARGGAGASVATGGRRRGRTAHHQAEVQGLLVRHFGRVEDREQQLDGTRADLVHRLADGGQRRAQVA